MSPTPEMILNAAALIFGFSMAFFHGWAYSAAGEPYEAKHLTFLVPLFASELLLASTIVLVLLPATSNAIVIAGPYLLALALLLLLLARLQPIRIEWKAPRSVSEEE